MTLHASPHPTRRSPPPPTPLELPSPFSPSRPKNMSNRAHLSPQQTTPHRKTPPLTYDASTSAFAETSTTTRSPNIPPQTTSNHAQPSPTTTTPFGVPIYSLSTPSPPPPANHQTRTRPPNTCSPTQHITPLLTTHHSSFTTSHPPPAERCISSLNTFPSSPIKHPLLFLHTYATTHHITPRIATPHSPLTTLHALSNPCPRFLHSAPKTRRTAHISTHNRLRHIEEPPHSLAPRPHLRLRRATQQ
jgi:hypothetical protein